MIEDGSLSDAAAVREGTAAASAALGEMVALLDGLASIARLDDHAEVLQRAPCRVDAVLAAVADSMSSEAAAKSIELKLYADPDLQVSADAGRLRIAVVNLLVNAIKYAPSHSTVGVEARRRGRGVSVTLQIRAPALSQPRRIACSRSITAEREPRLTVLASGWAYTSCAASLSFTADW